MNAEELKQIPREEREAFLKKATEAFLNFRQTEFKREQAEAVHNNALRALQAIGTENVEARRKWVNEFRDQLTPAELTAVLEFNRN